MSQGDCSTTPPAARHKTGPNDVTVTHFLRLVTALRRIRVTLGSHAGYGANKVDMALILTDKNRREKIIISEI